MSDSWSVPKPIGYLAALAAAVVAIGGAWKVLDLPVPATRAWVHEVVISPYQDDSLALLRLRRQVTFNELFLWESNATRDANILWNIERLRSDITAIDRQIATRATR